MEQENRGFSKEEMEKVFREIYKDTPPLLEKCEWIEGDKICHTWKINVPAGEGTRAVTGYTNDAGAAQINETIRKMVMGDEENTNEEIADTTE